MIVLLNPVFNCSNNFLFSCAERVTTGTYNSVSFISSVKPVGAAIAGLSPYAGVVIISVKTQFLDNVVVIISVKKQ